MKSAEAASYQGRGALRATQLVDALVTVLPRCPKPLLPGTQVRVHFGTNDSTARVYLLSGGLLEPGQSGYVQIRFARPVAAPAMTPLVIRTLSPAQTVAGGPILDTHPVRKAKLTDENLALLHALASDDTASKLSLKLREAGKMGRNLPELLSDLNLPESSVQSSIPVGQTVVTTGPHVISTEAEKSSYSQPTADAFEPLPEKSPTSNIILCGRDIAVHRDFFYGVQSDILAALGAFHGSNPRSTGMPRAALRRQMPRAALRRQMPPALKAEIFQRAVSSLVEASEIEYGIGALRAFGFVPERLTPGEARLMEALETRSAGPNSSRPIRTQ